MTTQAGQPGVTLVVGATGLVGGAVVRLLRQRGVPVRALVRDDSNRVRDLRELGCETARGDLKDTAAVAGSCQGVCGSRRLRPMCGGPSQPGDKMQTGSEP